MRRTLVCAFLSALFWLAVPSVAFGGTCSNYRRITDAGLNGLFDGVVEGFEYDARIIKVKFASVSSGTDYTCREVLSWFYGVGDQEEIDQERLNEQIRRAAVLSMTLGYTFNGRIAFDAYGEARLVGAGVAK